MHLSYAGCGYSLGTAGNTGPRLADRSSFTVGAVCTCVLSTGNSTPRVDTYSFSAVGPDLLVGHVLVGVAGVPLVAVGGDLLQPRVLRSSVDVGLLLTALVWEPVLLVLLVLVGGGGDPLVAVPGGLLLLLVQHSPQGMWPRAHTISFRDDLPERLTTTRCVLMALATSVSKALAVVTMGVFTG